MQYIWGDLTDVNIQLQIHAYESCDWDFLKNIQLGKEIKEVSSHNQAVSKGIKMHGPQ